jgi:hypothetical protein
MEVNLWTALRLLNFAQEAWFQHPGHKWVNSTTVPSPPFSTVEPHYKKVEPCHFYTSIGCDVSTEVEPCHFYTSIACNVSTGTKKKQCLIHSFSRVETRVGPITH